MRRRGFLGLLGATVAAPAVALTTEQKLEQIFTPVAKHFSKGYHFTSHIVMLTSRPVAPSEREEEDSSGRPRRGPRVTDPERYLRLDMALFPDLDHLGRPRVEVLARVAVVPWDRPYSEATEILELDQMIELERQIVRQASSMALLLADGIRADRQRRSA